MISATAFPQEQTSSSNVMMAGQNLMEEMTRQMTRWVDVSLMSWPRLLLGNWPMPQPAQTTTAIATAGARGFHVSVEEEEAGVAVHAQLPGFLQNEVETTIEDDILTIKAEKHHKAEREESHLSYRRRVPLPFRASEKLVQPSFESGVLELFIPKPESAKKEGKAEAAQTDEPRQAPESAEKAVETRGKARAARSRSNGRKTKRPRRRTAKA